MADLNIQNPWWKDPESIERDEKVIKALQGGKLLYSFDISKNTIVLGPRQVGKTTMLKLYIRDLLKKGANPRNIFYFSCEPISKKEELIEIMSEYDKISGLFEGKKYIFIDEVTFVKDWEIAIKYFVETLRTGILVATGSNASLLKTGTERLPGRDIDITFLLPLSFREVLIAFGSEGLKKALKNVKPRKFDLKTIYENIIKLQPFSREIDSRVHMFLYTGGYIKVIYEFLDGKISESTYRDYVNWILGDLSKLDRREKIFQGIIRGIISKYSSSFSLNSMSKEMEIHSHVSVSDYLEILQNLLLTNNLYQIDLNKKMPLLRKERKVYFIDPFMYSVFSGYSLGFYKPYINEEKIIEGIVCESLKRFLGTIQDFDKHVFFYKGKYETDFVLKREEIIGIEVKCGTGDRKDFKNFYAFKKKILLNKSRLEYSSNLLICPISLFLALL